jgi:signal transduction histidine kinase
MNAPDTSAGVGHAADGGVGRHPPGPERLRQLADEQAALRRVATLVAGGTRPAEVFTSVADELGRLIGAEATYVTRVDHLSGEREVLEGYLTVVGSYGRVSDQVPVGFRLKLQPGMIHTAALQRGRPARMNGEQLATGPLGAMVGQLGVQAAVATPIVVGGRNWGVMMAVTSREDFPAGTESRMADFMELAATAIANAQAEQELRELADTQGALRRLAILVAQGEPPEAVFAAATREARRHFGGGTARMIRYEPDGTETLLANEGTPSHVRVGERWEGYPPTGLTVTVRRTGRAGRVDDYRDVAGAEVRLREGILSSVAVPIYVNGQLWGMIAVGSGQAPLPPDTEQRMSEFTDLVATAVANAQNRAALETSRDELARLLAEQAALRRVATLVAREIDPAEIFSAVAEEIRRLLGADNAGIGRFEPDGAYCVIVSSVGEDQVTPVGKRVKVRGYHAPAVVWRTGRAAQTDEDAWSAVSDPDADALREAGIRSMVASPINVEGRLWGVVNALTRKGPFPAGSADRMADFTELAATAIGNAESRAELSASRQRIVAAADETRRQIERDLHDGTQQQLVSLGFELRVAQSVVPAGGLAGLQAEIGRIAGELNGVVEDLRETARGIHPAILSEGGLGPALRTLARRAAITVELNVAAITRLPEPVEVAAYYVVSEALTNATRHARASVVEVDAEASGGALRVRVRDDGAGGADPARGSGLVGLKDRIEALGGTFSLHSPVGGGTTVSCELPVRSGARQPDAGPGQ